MADEGIPVQTIAPKFTGRFNKGVDYVGDVAQFEREFNEDLAVIAFAVKQYGLPRTLKLSVHSGSDKFSIYGPMRRGAGAGLAPACISRPRARPGWRKSSAWPRPAATDWRWPRRSMPGRWSTPRSFARPTRR